MDKHKTQPQPISAEGNAPPVLAIVGNSGSGKTTFLEKLIPAIIRRGFKVGTIKHHAHRFDMDIPGKDSWRHKQAGASTTIISSPSQIGMVMDVDIDHNPIDLLHFFKGMDIILAEGYKRGNTPKIEVFRPETSPAPICQDDNRLLAVITDAVTAQDIPTFSFHDIHQVVDFIIAHFNLMARHTGL